MTAIRLGKLHEVGIAQRRAIDPSRILALLMHADRAEHAVIDQQHDQRRIVLHRGGKFLAGHHEVAVTGDRNHHALRMPQLGGDGRGHRIAHGTRGGCQLGLVAAMPIEAMNRRGEVAGAVGDDRVLRQHLVHMQHAFGIVQGAGLCPGHPPVGIVGAGRLQPAFPARRQLRRIAKRQRGQRRRKLTHAGRDRQISMKDATELVGAGKDMHQRLHRCGRFNQGIAVGGHLAQSHTDRNQQIALAHALRQFGIDADADFADVVRITIVEGVLVAPGAGHRQPQTMGK